ncbi:MAG: hypothetical protein HC896_14225 [Bacteroidales bacterium]|nr:hypothetical protein [Bacteroidales bacterium]
MKTTKIIGLIASAFLIFSCSTGRSSKQKSGLNYVYHPATSALNPRYLVYHENTITSSLIVKIFPGELKFAQILGNERLIANVKIHYDLYTSQPGQPDALVDSNSYLYSLDKSRLNERFLQTCPSLAIRVKLTP